MFNFGIIVLCIKQITSTDFSVFFLLQSVSYSYSYDAPPDNTYWIVTIRMSLLLFQSKEPPLNVLHILYPEWPDHGVPQDTLAVREIWRRLCTVPPTAGPIVVHCRLTFQFNNISHFWG